MLKSYVFLSFGAALLSGPCWGGDFLNGQAARAVIGQPTFNAQNFGASDTLLGGVGGLAYANNTLFVADSNRLGFLPNNNRVLIFNNIQQMVPAFDAEILPFSGRCPVCGGRASVVVGQPDFTSVAGTPITQSSLRLPTAVASDGNILAVADTANNRILIWRSIPATNGRPADVVLGQPDFVSVGRVSVTASSLRGPQGVWIQGSRLFVADTQNNRVMVWNSIPTQNNQPADLVLGQPDFTSSPQVNQVNLQLAASATTMLSPTSVTSDGTRLYVSDLGFNRVLIWNSMPTATQQPADLEIGQKDMTQSIPNDAANVCASNGTDTNGNATFPARCGKTLSFPRYALSDGTRLFIADGGNDRVLVFNSIPAVSTAAADVILGQPDEFSDVYGNNDPLVISAANITPTPTSLAWDGQNLYVVDATYYRVLVFSPAHPDVPLNSVLNGASRAVFAVGSIVAGGTITEKNTATVTINGTAYTYTILVNDTSDKVAKALTALINAGAGDPNVLATEENGFSTIRLVARKPGTDGNGVTLATSVSANATVTLTASGGNLAGGASAAIIAGGSVILVRGAHLADSSASASTDGVTLPESLPFELAGVQLYFDGMRAPLFSVSPTEIKAQYPFLGMNVNSMSGWVRIKHADGSVTVTTAVNVPIVDQNPGIFADETAGALEPRSALAVHASSFATGTISIDGSAQVGDTGTITIGGTPYVYTVVAGDTLATIREQFVGLINGNPDSPVTASAAGAFTRVRVQAKVPGAAGAGAAITVSTSTLSTNTGGVLLTLTPTNATVCCAGPGGTPITADSPAFPGETIIIYATGLGLITPDAAKLAIVDGSKYRGPEANAPVAGVSAQVGGASATVISASLAVGQIGVYQVVLELNSTVAANPQAQATISQGFNTSNIVIVPIGSPPQ